ncbi:twitching motility protein PilT [Spirochaetia bacterium]|nr:twitching motility protein PilT [Spirochaetia bacterium]
MSGVKAFVDTNVIGYLYSKTDLDKKKMALDAINFYDCIISTQVLNEFCNISIKKFHRSVPEILKAINEIYSACAVILLEPETIKHAMEIHKRYQYSYYDSLIVASALEQDCDYLLSEDMNDGQVIGKMAIKNIFKMP